MGVVALDQPRDSRAAGAVLLVLAPSLVEKEDVPCAKAFEAFRLLLEVGAVRRSISARIVSKLRSSASAPGSRAGSWNGAADKPG